MKEEMEGGFLSSITAPRPASSIPGKSSSESPAPGEGQAPSGIISYGHSLWQMKTLVVGVASWASRCLSLADLEPEPRCLAPGPVFFLSLNQEASKSQFSEKSPL